MTRYHGVLVFLLLMVSFQAAHAATQSCGVNDTLRRWVGDTASDSKCTDDTIQSAINAVAADGRSCGRIFVTREHTYTAQHLSISNTGKNITLVGQGDGVACGVTDTVGCFPTCPPPIVVAQNTISGTDGQSVLHIEGNNGVTLRYLTVTRANLRDDQTGGGIYFRGSGSLTLDTSVVSFNQAGAGGGIEFIGAPSATLTLLDNSLLIGNTATYTDGGGIRLEGDARLIVVSPNVIITNNHAPAGNGGGIEVTGPARVDIGSSSSGGVVTVNDAKNGGGIAAIDNGNGAAEVRIFPSVDNHATLINDNAATGNGGAFFTNGTSKVCVYQSAVLNNVANDGAAFYEEGRGGIYLNLYPADSDTCGPENYVTLLGGSGGNCDETKEPCNLFSGNSTTNPQGGAIVHVSTNGEILAKHVKFNQNIAGNLFSETGARTVLWFCVLTDNASAGPLIQSNTWAGGNTNIEHCTIANNAIAADTVIELLDQARTTLRYDLIAQPGHTSLNFSPYAGTGDLEIDYVMANEVQSFLPRSGAYEGNATFVDAAHGNYVPSRCSDAVDSAPVDSQFTSDYVGTNYGIDVPEMRNHIGASDIGAFEYPGRDTSIFCSSFNR